MNRLPRQPVWLCILVLVASLFLSGCQKRPAGPSPDRPPPQADTPAKTAQKSRRRLVQLFDGESLSGWEIGNFGGEGDCHAANGELTVEMGNPISGVISTREDLPTDEFEISLEAKRVQGIDFFCALTFPIDNSHCTFVVGGWAGAIVGLSCIDGKDASDNETNSLMGFEDEQWYTVRVRVADEKIQCWIDDKKVVDISTVDRKFTLRAETLMTRPLGICTFETTAVYRNIILTYLESNMEK